MLVGQFISEEAFLGSILLGAIHKMCSPGKGGGVVEPKGYIYYFGDIILLLKYVQKERSSNIWVIWAYILYGYTPRTKMYKAQAKVLWNDGSKAAKAALSSRSTNVIK